MMTKKLTIPVFIILVLGLGISALVVFVDWQPAPEPFLCNGQPCNVILIIPETLSARHMGIYGYERNTTPFIDEFFSEESIIFENAWSAAPWTFPSFAALFTSQLASDVFVENWGDKLSDKITTFVDVLDKAGIPKFAAHTRTLLPMPNLDANLITRFKPEERFLGEDCFLFLKAAEWIEEQVQKDKKQPFFLMLQPLAPHSPYNPPEPYRYFFDAPSEYPGPVTTEELLEVSYRLRAGEDIKTEKIERFRLQYDQEIRYLDSELESFIARIPEQVRQNTVFIFTSDHGEAFGQHNNVIHAVTLYEEEIHIPFFIRAPGIDQKRIQEPITLLDTGPTILEIFRLKSSKTFQGISLVAAMRGKELQLGDRIVKSENYFTSLTPPSRPAPPQGWSEIESRVRTGDSPTYSQEYFRIRALRRQEWKLFQRVDGLFELYNLERDYYEQNNLIPQWHDLPPKEQAEALPLFEALEESPPSAPSVAQEGDWKLLRNPDGSLELYNLKQDPEQQNNLLNNDGIPQWHFLLREEQLEIFPLFEALDENSPFIKIH